MSARVVVDPITCIEGHLRRGADGRRHDCQRLLIGHDGKGIEIILQGRDLRDAWAFAQRICGVCTLVHGIASVRSVEDALKSSAEERAADPQPHDRCRTLTVMHFYHLHALDWVDIVAAVCGRGPRPWRRASWNYRTPRRATSQTSKKVRPSSATRSGSSRRPTGDTRPTACRPKPT